MIQQVKLSERGKLFEAAKSSPGTTPTGTNGTSGVAEDVFRRVSELGGLLVVALVAPVPAGQGGGGSAMQAAMSAVAQKARELNKAEADSDRAMVAEMAAALKAGRLVQKP